MKRKVKSEKENKAKDLIIALDVILSILMVETALVAIDPEPTSVDQVTKIRIRATKDIIKVVKLLEKKNGSKNKTKSK